MEGLEKEDEEQDDEEEEKVEGWMEVEGATLEDETWVKRKRRGRMDCS